MVKARIQTRTGAVITIEGTEEEVSNVLSTFERTAAVSQEKKTRSKDRESQKEKKKRASASDLLVELKEDGFFEKPRSLGEVSKALEEQGYLYPTTTLSGVVLSLVQKKLLRRKKVEGKWAYGK